MAEERQTGAYVIQNHVCEKKYDGSTDTLYSKRNKEGEKAAIYTLSDKALRIYLILTSNKDGYQLTMSSTQIGGEPLPFGMSRSSYTRAIKELKDAGFLVKRPGSANQWDFYDVPKNEEIFVEIHKQESSQKLDEILKNM